MSNKKVSKIKIVIAQLELLARQSWANRKILDGYLYQLKADNLKIKIINYLA